MKSFISITLSGLAAIVGAQASEAPLSPQFVEVRSAATLPMTSGSVETFTCNMKNSIANDAGSSIFARRVLPSAILFSKSFPLHETSTRHS